MKALLFAVAVFLAWLGAGSVVTSGSIPRASGLAGSRAADLAAIG